MTISSALAYSNLTLLVRYRPTVNLMRQTGRDKSREVPCFVRNDCLGREEVTHCQTCLTQMSTVTADTASIIRFTVLAVFTVVLVL